MALDLLWLAALICLPGGTAVWALWSRTEPPSLPLGAALVLGCGYAVSGAVALALALAGVLSAAAFLIGVLAATAALALIAFRRMPPAVLLTDLRRQVRGQVPELAFGAVVLVLVAVSALRIDPAVNLATAGRWRYWADGLEIAALGHIPHTSTQWAAQYPTTVSKVFLNAFSAGFSSLAGTAVLPAYGALYLLGAVGAAAALWALAWELGLRRTAALLPLLCAAPLHLHGLELSVRFAGEPGLYKAELVGRMIAFTGLALAVHGLRAEGRRLSLVVAGLLLGAAAITHGVPFLIAVMLGVAVVVPWALRERRIGTAARAAGLVALPALAVACGALLLAGGDLGFGGATARYVPIDGSDPTALFAGKHRAFHTGSFYVQPWQLAQQLAGAAIGITPSKAVALLLAAALVAAAALALRSLPGELALMPVTGLVFGAMLLAAALVFSARSHAYIPGTFGQRRLYDYANLAVLLMVLPWVEAAAAWLVGLGRAAALAGAAVAALLVVGVAVKLEPPAVGGNARGLAAAMNAVRANVPCGARVLANRRSNAAFEVLAGRESVLEGMAPYLRPPVLARVLTQIGDAEQALRGDASGGAFLRRERVGYVVLLAGKAGLVAGATNPQALAQADGLTRVYGDSHVTIYRVEGAPAPGAAPPGYDCSAGPVRT